MQASFSVKWRTVNGWESAGEWLELCAGAGVPEPELRHILPEPELENSGRQNYEKLFHISTHIWH
jgi:hypothetical protein